MNFGNLIIDLIISYMQAWSRKQEIEGNGVVSGIRVRVYQWQTQAFFNE